MAALVIAAMGLLGFAAARLLRLSRSEMAALLVVVMFANSGNYGLTLMQFALW